MNEADRKVVVFLDTNALHFIHLYLARAEGEGLYPFGAGEYTIAKAREHLGNVRDNNLKEGLAQGLDIVAGLAGPEVDVRVEYSPVSELELMVGRAKGRAIVNAAKEGVPDRMWTRFHDEWEISARLTTADLSDVRTTVEGLGSPLERAGIPATVSDPDRTRDVLDLAKEVAGLVYLGLADSVIYASALVAGADYLITTDKYFRKTVNRIRTGQEPHDEIRQKLRDLVGQIAFTDPDNIALPEAKRAL